MFIHIPGISIHIPPESLIHITPEVLIHIDRNMQS
jgi:hypothetical protein